MGVRFRLQQFSALFKLRNPDGQPYVLVGGQAVNYWAEHYISVEPDLKKHLPFTSADVDFRGNRDDVEHIAGQLKLPPVFPNRINMTALAGAIPFSVGNQSSNIEVVRLIPGVSAATLDELAIDAESNGQHIRVIDPISLLACKLNLSVTISQTNRQDVEHLRILTYCVRGFLREILLEVERGEIPAKGWLGAVNRLTELVTSTHGRRAAKNFGIHWGDILPAAEIAKAKNMRIVSFREKQMGRVFGISSRG